MSVDENVQTLVHCTNLLGRRPDAADTLDSGFLLLHNLSADEKLCEKVTQKLAGLGELLVKTRDTHRDALSVLRENCARQQQALAELQARVDEGSINAILEGMQQLMASLETIDTKYSESESAFARLESWCRCLDMVCAKHGRAKTTAGGVFIASGCLALTLSAATFLIKCAVQTTGGAFNPAAALIFRFSPLNTALAGGIVTMLGVSDTRHSQRYSQLTLTFRDYADDLQKEIATSRSFRTRVQRLRHAVEAVTLSLHVTTALHKVEASTWNLMTEWIRTQEKALKMLTSHTAV